MVCGKVTVINDEGLHMRPAGLFAKAAASHSCSTTIVYNGKRTNAKSVMSVMLAGVNCGAEIELECDGEDEAETLAELTALIESGFK